MGSFLIASFYPPTKNYFHNFILTLSCTTLPLQRVPNFDSWSKSSLTHGSAEVRSKSKLDHFLTTSKWWRTTEPAFCRFKVARNGGEVKRLISCLLTPPAHLLPTKTIKKIIQTDIFQKLLLLSFTRFVNTFCPFCDRQTSQILGLWFRYEISQTGAKFRLLTDSNRLAGWFLFGQNARCLNPISHGQGHHIVIIFKTDKYQIQIYSWFENGKGGDPRGLLTNPVEAACHASLIVTPAPSGHLHLGGDLRICFRPTFHFEFNFQFHVLIINFDQSFEVVCNVHGSFCLL